MWDLKNVTDIRRWYALHLVLCFTFFISSLIINLVQISLFFTLRPLNKSLFRQINYYLLYSLAAQILFIAEWWSGSDVRVYSSDASFATWGKEKSLVVMNHNYEVDWLMGWIVADRSNILGGAKVFVKDMMRYVPTIGWAWSCSDIIFVKRNWKEDQKNLRTQLAEFYDYPYPMWMLLFCEGTRFTKEKHQASMEFAKEKGLPHLKHLLIPRTRGFVQCCQSLKGKFASLYDVTLAFKKDEGLPEPTLVNMLRGQKIVGDLYIRRIPFEDIPADEKEAAEYIHELYRTKDQFLENYYTTGSFVKEEDKDDCRLQNLPRRYYSLINIIVWTCVVTWMLLNQFYSLLISGSMVPVVIALSVVVLAYYGLHKLIGLTHIKKGSDYGNGALKNK